MRSIQNITWAAAFYALSLACAGAAPATTADGFASNVLNRVTPARASNTKFLPVEQAFGLTTADNGHALQVFFRVTAGHYLYQSRFQVLPSSGVQVSPIQFDQNPTEENDPEFGQVKIFDRDVMLTVPYQGQGEVTLRWQGCAKAGLCYPPQDRRIVLAATRPPVAMTADQPPLMTDPRTRLERAAGVQSIRIPMPIPLATIEAAQVAIQSENAQPAVPSESTPSDALDGVSAAPLINSTSNSASPAPNAAIERPALPTAMQVDTDPFRLAEHPLTALALLFLAGLALAFTPCVLPMLPIVANVVARQHRRSAWHGLQLSGAYALGVASSYAVLGALVAIFGRQLNVIGWLQQPMVLVGFAALFALLALNAFDLVPLRLPHRVGQWIGRVGQIGQGKQYGGRVLGSALTGFFSALVVSPCVSAPLTGVLLSVSTVGDPVLGAAALFMLGLGLSLPLMLLGATEGRFLPQSGQWMHWIRQGFGLLLLGVSLVLLGRVWNTSLMLLAWSALFMLLAAWMWQWAGRGRWVAQACAALLAAWSLLQLFGVAQGQHDPWQPLAQSAPVVASANAVQTVYRADDVARIGRTTPRLLVEVTADWCISCKVMERELFGATQLPQLATWTRIKLDVTQNTPDSQQALDALQLFGPPALLFYVNGQPVARLVGQTSSASLQQQLDALGDR